MSTWIASSLTLLAMTMSPKVAVIGGSLGGLMAAVALQGAGCEVDVYERVPQRLEGLGAGLRIVPEMAALLQDRAGINLRDASTFTPYFRQIGAGDRIVANLPIPGQFTSWGALHRALSAAFDGARYHLGEACVALEQRHGGVAVRFASGRVEPVDLVVFADGILSTGRRLIAPEARLIYAGYVTWRGYVPATALSAATRELFSDAVTYVVIDRSHGAIYPIPDPNGIGRGPSFFNFVWYRNVEEGDALDDLMTDRTGTLRPISLPAGMLQERHAARLKADAQALLPPAAAEVVCQTREPFLQALYDVTVERMADGRACLIGDAAFATRPHAGAATTKAAVDAWRLAEKLVAHDGNVPAALAAWEPDQLAVGRAFVKRNQAMGTWSLVENRFDPTSPEIRPGLYGPGR
jgi:2,6-dihydroxypyridine 3-monooxygenase